MALGMSASEVHAAVKRALVAKLATAQEPRRIWVQSQNLLEFLVHGAKYAFPAARGPVTRGYPTSYAAPALRQRLVGNEGLPPVWPDPEAQGSCGDSSVPSPIRFVRRIVPARCDHDSTRRSAGGSCRQREHRYGWCF